MYLLLLLYPVVLKIGYDSVFIYPQEIIFYLFIMFLLITGSYSRKFIPVILLIFGLHLFLMVHFAITKDNTSIAYIKQFAIFYILLIPQKYFSKVNVFIIFKVWLIVGIFNLLYIVGNYLVLKPSALEYLFNYHPMYRIIGFTGSGIDLKSFEIRSSFTLNEIGTTTISLSILYAFIALVFIFSSLKHPHRKSVAALLLCGATFSRSGLAAYFISICVYFIRQRVSVSYFYKITPYFVALITLLSLSMIGLISVSKFDFSAIENFITVLLRLKYWGYALEFFANNVSALAFGVNALGYNIFDVIRIDYAESLFLDLLINYGVFPVIIVLLIFYQIFFKKRKFYSDLADWQALLPVFGVGLFMANVMAGSSFLTDFLMPIILSIIIKYERS